MIPRSAPFDNALPKKSLPSPWPDGPGKSLWASPAGILCAGLPSLVGQSNLKSRSALCGGILLPSAGTRPGAPFAEGFYWPSRTRAPKRPSAEGFYWPAVPTAPPPSRLSRREALLSPPPAPSHALTKQRRMAYRHGRGTVLYSLIPKGGLTLPPLISPHGL